MNSNLSPGTNSIATLTAVQASELPLDSDDGLPTSDILTVMGDENLSPTDNLQYFGLGPC
jgi:hypothetical protein